MALGTPIHPAPRLREHRYPGEPKEIAHFEKMLRTTARHLSESEIKLLLIDAARK